MLAAMLFSGKVTMAGDPSSRCSTFPFMKVTYWFFDWANAGTVPKLS